MFDSPIGQVSNSSYGARSLTPTTKRTTTPVRSSSAPKQYLSNSLDDNGRSLSNSVSRRRVRRFENANLFGVATVLGKHGNRDDSDDEEEDPGLFTSLGSIFSDLARVENREALDFYLSCEHLHRTRRVERYKSEAEKSWLNVEARIRRLVLEVIRNEPMADFLDAAELLVVFFQVHRSLPPPQNIPQQILDASRSPVSIVDGRLIVPLIDSSFTRLVFHAVCQYHGLKSASVNASCMGATGKAKKMKDIVITLRKSNKLFGHGIAMRSLLQGSPPSRIQELADYDVNYVFV